MNSDWIIQLTITCMAFIFLIIKIKGMKRYFPLAIFAIIYANIWYFLYKYFHLFSYPIVQIPFTFYPAAFNYLLIPISVMFWMRYCPINVYYKILWGFGWSAAAIIIQYILMRFTNIIIYLSNQQIFYSYIFWLISWYIFYKFHNYLTYDKFFEE